VSCLGFFGDGLRIEVFVEELYLDQERKGYKDELSRRRQDSETQMNFLREKNLKKDEHESQICSTYHFLSEAGR